MTAGTVAALPWPVLYAPILSASIVSIVAVFTAVIQWRQWVAAKTKVKLDLYHMRLPVFLAMRRLLGSIRDGEFPTEETLLAVEQDIEQAPFLFDDAFASDLQGTYSSVVHAKARAVAPPDPRGESMWAAQAKQIADYEPYVRKQYRELIEKFAPYLRLEGRAGA
jgi:hypothetical protein